MGSQQVSQNVKQLRSEKLQQNRRKVNVRPSEKLLRLRRLLCITTPLSNRTATRYFPDFIILNETMNLGFLCQSITLATALSVSPSEYLNGKIKCSWKNAKYVEDATKLCI